MKNHLFIGLMACLLGLFLVAGLATVPAAHAQNAEADAVIGVWKNGEGTGLVQIYKAKDEKYYGKIVWLKVANDAQGKPRTDINNPNKDLRNRPLKGLENLRGFTYANNNVWDGGQIYDPKTGNDYSCKMTLTDPNTLEVRGFIGISLLGRTDVWKRQQKRG